MDQLDLEGRDLRTRRRRRGLLAMLVSLAIVTLGAGTMSLAIFTDQTTADGSWTAGTIVLGTSPTTVFTVTDMMPGDSGSQTLTVSNDGTGDLRYSMTSSSDDTDGLGLRDQLTLQIQPGACPSIGADLFNGALSGAAFGDATQGADTDDRDLAAGASEDLCFSWSFPLDSDDTYQGATTSTTFTFDAEQTANNP